MPKPQDYKLVYLPQFDNQDTVVSPWWVLEWGIYGPEGTHRWRLLAPFDDGDAAADKVMELLQ